MSQGCILTLYPGTWSLRFHGNKGYTSSDGGEKSSGNEKRSKSFLNNTKIINMYLLDIEDDGPSVASNPAAKNPVAKSWVSGI